MTKKTLGKRTLSVAASAAIVLTSLSGQFPEMSRTWAAADGVVTYRLTVTDTGMFGGGTTKVYEIDVSDPGATAPSSALPQTASDGLPIFYDYTQTDFYFDNPLGIPGNFHLFGFNSVTAYSHVNGNFATPHYHKSAMGGPGMGQAYVPRMLDVAAESIDELMAVYDADQKKVVLVEDPKGANHNWDRNYSSDLYVPVDYDFFDPQPQVTWVDGQPIPGSPDLDYPFTRGYGHSILALGDKDEVADDERIVVNGNANPAAYAHVGEGFIDFEAEREKAFELSEEYAAMTPNVEIDWDSETATLSPNGLNVLSLKASDFKNGVNLSVKGVNLVDGEYKGDQTIIVNIDAEGEDAILLPSSFFNWYLVDDTKMDNGEEAALKQGTNILYNIYNGSDEEGVQPHVKAGKSIGAYLAPGFGFTAISVDGIIIADDIVDDTETHAAFFNSPLSAESKIKVTGAKVWTDGDEHASDTVQLTLYRALQSGMNLDDVQKLAANGDTYLADTLASYIKAPAGGMFGPTRTYKLQNLTTGEAAEDVEVTNDGSMKKPGPDGEVIFKRVTDSSTGTDHYECTRITDGKVIAVREVESDGEGGYRTIRELKAQEVEQIGDPITVAKEDQWQYEWTELDKLNASKLPYYYYIVEAPVAGYTTAYAGNGASNGNRTITVSNTGSYSNGIEFRKVNDAKKLNDKKVVESASERLAGVKLRLTLTTPTDENAKINNVGVNSSYHVSDAEHSSDTPGYYSFSEDGMSVEWTTDGKDDIRFRGGGGMWSFGNTTSDLPDGTYTFEELKGPADGGYAKMAPVTVIVKGGEVVSATADFTKQSVTAVNQTFRVAVLKKQPATDRSAEAFVPGATLTLSGEDAAGTAIDLDAAGVVAHDGQLYNTADGHAVSDGSTAQAITTNKLTDTDADATVYEWMSTGSAAWFEKLPVGDYTIHEKVTPNGYQSSEDKKFKISQDENGFPVLSVWSGTEYVSSANNQITLYDEQDVIELSKHDMDGVPVDGATFRLTSDKNDLSDVRMISSLDQLSDEVTTDTADDGDGDAYNDKVVTIQATGDFTIIGNTFNHVAVNGTKVNADVELNKYKYEGTATDKIEISGLYNGIYTVTLADGTEYIIRADATNTEITSVEKLSVPTMDGDAIVADAGDVFFVNLADGQYQLEETAAPSGYEVVTTFEFTVADGKVASIDTVITSGDVKLAEMLDGSGNPIMIDEDGDTVEKDASDAWVKTNGLGAANGAVTSKKDASHIMVCDDRSGLKISKTDIAGSAAVEGAEMTLKLTEAAEEGKVLNAKVKDAVTGEDTDEYVVQVSNAKGNKVTRDTAKDSITWISSDKDVVLRNLPDGTYELTEVAAPDGYTKVTSSFTFTIKDGAVDTASVVPVTDGDVELIGLGKKSDNTDDDMRIVVKDTISTISISKEDLGGNVLEGAEMVLTLTEAGKNTEAVLNAKDTEDNYKLTVENAKDDAVTRTADSITWTSSDKDVVMKGLPDGTYSLKETAAPDGYTVVTEFTFTIEDGVITDIQAPKTTGNAVYGKKTVEGEEVDDNTKLIVMDEMSSISVTKKDITSKETLAGAKLTLTLVTPDTEGADINAKTGEGESAAYAVSITNAKDADRTAANKITWYSTEKDAVITGLPDGIYTLEETADSGTTFTVDGTAYDVLDSTVTFVVKNGVITKSYITGGDETELSAFDTDSKDAGYYRNDNLLTVADAKHKENAITIDKKAVGGEPIPEASGKAQFYLFSTQTFEDTDAEGATVQVSVLEKVLVGDSGEPAKVGKLTGADAELGYYIAFDGNSAKLTGLTAGEYTLREVTAPDGFTVVSDFTFTIDDSGIITNVGKTTNGNATKSADGSVLTVEDAVSTISISKEDMGGKVLEGAEMVLTLTEAGKNTEAVLNAKDADDNYKLTVENAKDGKVTRTADSITWTSSDEDVVMKGLPDGTYSMVETVAPDGYTVVTEFTFTIKNGVITDIQAPKTTGDAVYGKKTVDGEEVDDNTKLIVKDEISVITIDKKALGGEPIPSESGKAQFRLYADKDAAEDVFSTVTVKDQTVTVETDAETGRKYI
ncbi:MAG: Cna B-type domain-containing protein, partial [Oscillospiraceae bacterium]|nr:Cna B-type domain-containing protein [Oscillospiraceae bacterium]